MAIHPPRHRAIATDATTRLVDASVCTKKDGSANSANNRSATGIGPGSTNSGNLRDAANQTIITMALAPSASHHPPERENAAFIVLRLQTFWPSSSRSAERKIGRPSTQTE